MMLSLLTLLFVALKLTGFIDWSWLFVVMPTLIQCALVLLVIIVGAFAVAKRKL
jgi:hypothetical protein